MATDRHGREVNVGDTVMIPCWVLDVYNFHGEDRSVLTLETCETDAGGSPNRFQVEGTQVDRVTPVLVSATTTRSPMSLPVSDGGEPGANGSATGSTPGGVAAGDGGEPVK